MAVKVPVDVIKKARKGSVRLRKAGYRVEAAHTPNAPAAVPTIPPPIPPLRVALAARQSHVERQDGTSRDHVLVVLLLFFFGGDLHRGKRALARKSV